MLINYLIFSLLIQYSYTRFTNPIIGGYQPGYSESYIYDHNQAYHHHTKNNNNYKLIFSEEFDELDLSIWRHEITLGGGGNWEFQFYTNNRSSSYTKDGHLYLKPILTTNYLGISDEALIKDGTLDVWGNAPNFQCTANAFYGCQRKSDGNTIINPIMSTQLRSHRAFDFRYGKVEVRAKLPKGDWLWPAIWFLPTHHQYGGWPASGEIDLVESRGNAPGYSAGGIDTVASTLHWGPDWAHNRYNLTSKSFKLPNGETFNDKFHTFTLEWGKDFIRTMIDDQHILLDLKLASTSFWELGQFPNSLFNPWSNRPNIAPFDQKFYIILNLAVGGTNFYFPDDEPGKLLSGVNKKPWKNTSPHAAKDFLLAKNEWYPTWLDKNGNDEQSAMIVDYIRVYSFN